MPYKDKEDQAKCAKKHYEANKDLYKKRAMDGKRKAYIRNTKFVKEYLSTHPCVDCGNDNILVLEFDHVTGNKLKAISIMVRNGSSIKKIKEEITKCEVRCANCHRIRTHETVWNK